MDTQSELQSTVDELTQAGKGLLAADESGSTIAKRFKTIGVESTEQSRRAWRSLLLSTPGLPSRTRSLSKGSSALPRCIYGERRESLASICSQAPQGQRNTAQGASPG